MRDAYVTVALAVGFVLVWGPRAVQGANLLTNPGFESPDASAGDVPGSHGWGSFNFAYTTALVAYSGAQAGKLFGPFHGYWDASGFFQIIPVTAGQTYRASAWALNLSTDALVGNDFGDLKLEWLDGSGGLISSDEVPFPSTSPTDVWTKLTLTVVAPAGAVNVRYLLMHVAEAYNPGAVFFDDAVFERVVPTLLGDTNRDGVVDLADYNNVVNNLGASGTGVLGDTNDDALVDLADYNNVVNNLGAQAPASLAVPEPAGGLILMGIAGLVALGRGRCGIVSSV